ncbi:MAG: NADH:flavin oxidoreductase, partial [Nocardioidaceae bacterium]|nr:NADH:flavin oxidoreductase [Nocardioidaceae bacterium]
TYYARRAASLGLIITEGTYINHPAAWGYADVPHFYGDDAFEGWGKVASAVHAEGGLIFPQLWHLGARRVGTGGPETSEGILSPSGIGLDGSPIGAAASKLDLDSVIGAYVQAAADAQTLGFDGVELHGAHGYLLDQFHWTATNHRDDTYGGDLADRIRLSVEVVAGIRAAVGPDFPICFRYSQWKGGHYDARNFFTPGELEQFLVPLTEAGVSVWHPSTRRYWDEAFDGSPRTLAGWTKDLTDIPTITVGSVGVGSPYRAGAEMDKEVVSSSLAPLLELFEKGEFDLVAIGRAVLSDADWTTKVHNGDAASITTYLKEHEYVLD